MSSESKPAPSPEPVEDDTAYGLDFWMAFAANMALMVGVSVLFRYGAFVKIFDGSDFDLGLIVGIGTIGALVMRIAIGLGIDRYGTRRTWLISLAGVIVSIMLHLTLTSVHSPGVYLARILLSSSLSGAFGSSITYVSLLAPRHRMAEMVGVLGSSGFVGQAIGPTIADWIFAGPVTDAHLQVRYMFWLAACMSVVSFALVVFGTHGDEHEPPRRMPPFWGILRRYHPGILLLMGVAANIGLMLPTTFLQPYADLRDIHELKAFFLVYSLTGFAVRVASRRLTEDLGFGAVIAIGMGLLALGTTSFLLLELPSALAGDLRSAAQSSLEAAEAARLGPWGGWAQYLLVVPALISGVAHALIFPAVVANGCSSFPDRYRGTATTLILASFDFGGLIGPPIVGALVVTARTMGVPGYPLTFLCVAAMLIGSIVVFALCGGLRGREVDLLEKKVS